MKDGVLKLATGDGDETLPGTDVTAPYLPRCAIRRAAANQRA
jgi:hypothetical protein